MKVCKCDRCGRIFEPVFQDKYFYSRVMQIGLETFDLVEPEGEIEDTYDLCDECYADLQRWIKRGALKNKNG